MENPRPCPKCGEVIADGAERCPSCAEAFASGKPRNAFWRWRAENPNSSLVVIVLVLLATARISVYGMRFVPELALHLPGSWFDVFIDAVRAVEIALSLVTAILWIAMIVVIPFANIRAYRSSRSVSAVSSVNDPAPIPDSPSESN